MARPRAIPAIITDSCPCGVRFHISGPDPYRCNDQHDQWLDAHEDCRAATVATVASQPYRPSEEPHV